jgi:phenylacetate-coenzyme A ligase PaaK-like adenylate-forming protein
MRALAVEIEALPGTGEEAMLAARVAQKLREALGLTVPVHVVGPGALPRFEMKARRFVVEA